MPSMSLHSIGSRGLPHRVRWGCPCFWCTLGRALIRARVSLPRAQNPVVFTWLEALDLGGHSVLMWAHVAWMPGLFYRDEEAPPASTRERHSLSPTSTSPVTLRDCASVFVPYGALQARKTGHIAAEQMLGALVSTSPQPAYHYWAGDGTQARAQGLKQPQGGSRAPITTAAAATEQAFGRPLQTLPGRPHETRLPGYPSPAPHHRRTRGRPVALPSPNGTGGSPRPVVLFSGGTARQPRCRC